MKFRAAHGWMESCTLLVCPSLLNAFDGRTLLSLRLTSSPQLGSEGQVPIGVGGGAAARSIASLLPSLERETAIGVEGRYYLCSLPLALLSGPNWGLALLHPPWRIRCQILIGGLRCCHCFCRAASSAAIVENS